MTPPREESKSTTSYEGMCSPHLYVFDPSLLTPCFPATITELYTCSCLVGKPIPPFGFHGPSMGPAQLSHIVSGGHCRGTSSERTIFLYKIYKRLPAQLPSLSAEGLHMSPLFLCRSTRVEHHAAPGTGSGRQLGQLLHLEQRFRMHFRRCGTVSARGVGTKGGTENGPNGPKLHLFHSLKPPLGVSAGISTSPTKAFSALNPVGYAIHGVMRNMG